MAGSGSHSADSLHAGVPIASPASAALRPFETAPGNSGKAVANASTTAEESHSDATQPTSEQLRPGRLTKFVGWLRRWLVQLGHNRSAPGFLVSFIVHTALLLTLAIWTIAATGTGGQAISLIAVMGEDQGEFNVEVVNSQLASGEVSDNASESVEATVLAPRGPESVSAGSMGEGLKDLANNQGIGGGSVSKQEQSAAGALSGLRASSTDASLANISVDGRDPKSRQRLALERGGNADSEAAVERALAWLAAHQRPDGHWSLVHLKDECGPYCTHPGSPERYEPAATGLALLAFLGAGYTHRDGKYADNVKRGLYYLLQIQERTNAGGSFLHSSPHGMYNHGVATFALCEAYQLSKDESLKTPAREAIEFICYAQNDAGGWGYLPKRPGDLTITGWQTMALKSADAAGLYIPAQVILRIDNFLDSQTDKEKVFYGYSGPGKSDTCTAIGLLLRLFRNWPHSDPRVMEGANYLERQGISTHDVYRNYYATLLLYHVGGPMFARWNQSLRDSLVQTQDRNGHANGSWYFDDKWGEVGGRLYTTAMAAMTLEVYYRFSPLYQNSDKPFEFKAR